MGKKTRSRAAPQKRSETWLCGAGAYDTLCVQGYTRLAQNPEILSAVGKIANLISSMTIHLMANTENGDVRVKNELSRKIDISPSRYLTRKDFMYTVVRALLLDGDGNAVVYPRTRGGLIEDLIPIPPSRAALASDGGWGYRVVIDGVDHDPDTVLHFRVNPDPEQPWRGQGYRVALREVAQNLKQAAATTKGFLTDKWKPSIIVKVDALTDEFASEEGRKRLMKEYLSTGETGEPWMVPAGLLEFEQVKPLTLQDLALTDSVKIDKQTVAAVLGVPPYVVGAGSFNRDEWNNFINTTVMPLATGIVQEMTEKLLLSPEWYFKFNPRSLYAYDIKDLAQVGDDQFVRGIMSGNEVRDWLGMSPREGLDELVILENYIPRGMIADQNKLQSGEVK